MTSAQQPQPVTTEPGRSGTERSAHGEQGVGRLPQAPPAIRRHRRHDPRCLCSLGSSARRSTTGRTSRVGRHRPGRHPTPGSNALNSRLDLFTIFVDELLDALYTALHRAADRPRCLSASSTPPPPAGRQRRSSRPVSSALPQIHRPQLPGERADSWIRCRWKWIVRHSGRPTAIGSSSSNDRSCRFFVPQDQCRGLGLSTADSICSPSSSASCTPRSCR